MTSPNFLVTNLIDFRKAFPVNDTSTSFTQRDSQKAVPSAAGVIPTGITSNRTFNTLLVSPYAVGANNTGFRMRLTGWRAVARGEATELWVASHLADVDCTLGTCNGVAAAAVLDTELFADTLSQINGTTAMELISPANDEVASLAVDTKGLQYIQFAVDINSHATASAVTSANALYAWI
jgi:hypothetical protein